MRKTFQLLLLSMLLLFSVSLPALAADTATTMGPVVDSAVNPDQINVGDEFTVDVVVRDVADLAGVGFELLFDPQVLEVVDADTQTDGVQVADGNVFAGKSGFMQVISEADNTAGTVKYSAIVTKPASAFTGAEATIAGISFRAKAPGACELKFIPNTVGDDGISLSTISGGLITAAPFSATVKVLPPVLEKTIQVQLTNAGAANTGRPLGIAADAFEGGNPEEVAWTAEIKNEDGAVIVTLDGQGEEFNQAWTPPSELIPADLPITKACQVVVTATFDAGDGQTETKTETLPFTLSNYDLVIKNVAYAGGKITVTVENLAAQAKNNVDCVLQLSQAGGAMAGLVTEKANFDPGVNTVDFTLPALGAGIYNAGVFLWDLAAWQTLSSPAEIVFTVS